MSDFNARHVIEALRSGVPSLAVGEYFSEARPGMLRRIRERLDAMRESGASGGMIYTGRYGEGKTHLLNTIFSQAAGSNLVVSCVSLGKETPIDKPWLLYQKLAANTYLPGARQPGFRQKLEALTPGSGAAGELLAYTATQLQTNKLYFLLRALLGTQEEEERALFLADLEGDFVSGAVIKKSFRRITGDVAKFDQNFSKVRHSMDYFHFLAHLFPVLGYDGWVLLFDEAELVGRLGKKARAKSYREMQNFLSPPPGMERSFSLFALSSSFVEDVIDRKHEYENAEAVFAGDPEALKAAKATLDAMVRAPELAPLTKEEITRVLMDVQRFHAQAYDWNPDISAQTLYEATEAGGYLLRTKLRAAIEFFDQLYQYGEAGKTKITELGRESFEEEDDTPELPDLEEI
ncbi:MAG: DUF2791 family P-loop domain-containing protein [Oscillospiraceae bacterium]|nr:DUF2791 family P-loop domain-containing protein [Oscillospiraceae bacterium]